MAICAPTSSPWWPLASVPLYVRQRQEVNAGAIRDDEAGERLERLRSGVWTALDSESMLLVVVDVGPRTLAMAPRVVHHLVQVVALGCVPLFLTDGCKEYRTARLAHFGQWSQPAWRQNTGPRPTPRWRPLPALLYAQGGQASRRWRLVRGTHRVVFGTPLAIAQIVSACGWTINPACIERLNLDLRQRAAAVGRRVNTLGKGADGWRDQLPLFQPSHTLLFAPCQRTSATADTRSRTQSWLSQGVATGSPGAGGGLDRSGVVAERGAPLSRAAGATPTSPRGGERGQRLANGAGQACLHAGKEDSPRG